MKNHPQLSPLSSDKTIFGWRTQLMQSSLLQLSFLLAAFLFTSLIANAVSAKETEEETFVIPAETAEIARKLRDSGLQSDHAYKIVESLSTEIGPRFAGTPQDVRARQWGVKLLSELGFSNVRVEEFPLDLWTRGDPGAEVVKITAPF
ncbi:MAG: hypothetical protein AAGJ37_05445, partial [Pseudomonadota bacterium]